jgi:hypothetical protein
MTGIPFRVVVQEFDQFAIAGDAYVGLSQAWNISAQALSDFHEPIC